MFSISPDLRSSTCVVALPLWPVRSFWNIANTSFFTRFIKGIRNPVYMFLQEFHTADRQGPKNFFSSCGRNCKSPTFLQQMRAQRVIRRERLEGAFRVHCSWGFGRYFDAKNSIEMLSRNYLTLTSLTRKIGEDSGTGLNRLTDKRDSKIDSIIFSSFDVWNEVK